MSSNGINILSASVNGLNSLDLDELSANVFKTGTMNGDLTYIKRIEANEIIVDTKLTLTPTGIISVGSSTISDVELTYLDGVTSNIQTQINNANTSTTGLQSQITALQVSDISQNTLLSTHTTQITALQNKTVWQSATSTTTDFSKQVNFPNGNIGFVNTALPNNFYIQSNLASGNNIYIKSGQANILLQTQNCYLGKTDAASGRKSNLYMLASDGSTFECQSSAFTESLKTQYNGYATALGTLSSQISTLSTSDTAQNTTLTSYGTRITNVENKTQNITATSSLTTSTKPLAFTVNGEVIKMTGTNTNISGYDSTTNTRDWALGNASSANKKINLIVDKQDSLNFISGTNASNLKGRNDLNTYSNGIKLYRGWSDSGNTLEYIGGIGALNTSISHMWIAGNGTNPIYIDAGLGNISLVSNTLWVGSTAVAAGNGYKSNINMLNSTGNWETQSRCFTDSLYTQVINSTANCTSLRTDVNNATANVTAIIDNIDILFARLTMQHYKMNLNFDMFGLLSTLSDNTAYTSRHLNSSFVMIDHKYFNLGAYLHANGYSSFFDSAGVSLMTKNYLLQLSVVFYHNFSNITNLQSQIQIVNATTGVVSDSTNLHGISSTGYAGNYTTQQQFCQFITDSIPFYAGNYGISIINIKSLFDFTTLTGPFTMAAYVRFTQTT